MWIRCNCVAPAGSREDLIPAWLAALEAQEEISIENLELNSGTFAGLEWVGAHLEAQSPISEPAGQRQWRSQLGARLKEKGRWRFPFWGTHWPKRERNCW